MELYAYFTTIMNSFSMLEELPWDYLTSLLIAGGFSFALWLVLFMLQAIGLFVMAKKRNIKHKWLAFMPFANIMFIGKIVGECSFFGRKIKRAGLYTMLAQIIGTIIVASVVAGQIYLDFKYPNMEEAPVASLFGFERFLGEYILYSGFLVLIVEMIYKVFSLILLIGLCKKYSPSNYLFLSFLVLLIPDARFIIVFALRKKKAVDYGEYIRAKHEEFVRRQQQYYNAYGNPYARPNGGYYGNPYANPYQKPTQPTTPDEPFSEFSSDKSKDGVNENAQTTGENNVEADKDTGDFFD